MPWSVRELLKIQPIDLVVETSLEAIRAGTLQLAKRMPKEAKFRVNLHRRDTKLDRKTLLHEVATQLPGEVDLEDFEWICSVEILGPVTGLALIKESEILTMRRP
jgi:tRNA(Ser,Leu) C12 N-acetylase TAN1